MNFLRHFAKILAGLLVLLQLGLSYGAFAAIAPSTGQTNIEVLVTNTTVALNTVHYQTAKKRWYPAQSLALRLYQKLPNLKQINSQNYTVLKVQQGISRELHEKLLKILLHTRLQQASYRS